MRIEISNLHIDDQQSEVLRLARTATLKLLAYCRGHDWAGHDPYDALNSRVFQACSCLDFKLARLCLTQALKRCPFDLRPLLRVPKSHNAKGVALFLTSLLKLSELGLLNPLELPRELAEKLLVLRSPQNSYWCWGYNFAWQTRRYLVPSNSPNVICTTFAANALLDAYEKYGEPGYLEAAVSAAQFILSVLYWRGDGSVACFSYTPLGRSRVHNANLLGAALLCRVAEASGERKFIEPALQATRYSVSRQHEDGSWDYGESDRPPQRWKDNFHTGFNLCALRSIGRYAITTEFEPSIQRGFEYYRRHFFREDAAPKYFNDRTYPVDIHSVAQSMITLLALKDLDPGNVALAGDVFRWAMTHLWSDRGYFYFQKLSYCTVKISYMRWSQAWMLLALAAFLDESRPSSMEMPGAQA